MWGSWKQYETTKAKKWQWPLSKCSPEIKVILMLTCWCPVEFEVGVISLQCRYTEQQQIAYEDFQNEEISIWWKALVERSGTALVALSALTSPQSRSLSPLKVKLTCSFLENDLKSLGNSENGIRQSFESSSGPLTHLDCDENDIRYENPGDD